MNGQWICAQTFIAIFAGLWHDCQSAYQLPAALVPFMKPHKPAKKHARAVKTALRRRELGKMKKVSLRRSPSADPNSHVADVRAAFGLIPPEAKIQVLAWPEL
jgi:hypothetical protein